MFDLSRTPRLALTSALARSPTPRGRPTATPPTCALTWRKRSVLISRPCPSPWHPTVTTMPAPVSRQTRALTGHRVGLQPWPLRSNVSGRPPGPQRPWGVRLLALPEVRLTRARSGAHWERGNRPSDRKRGSGGHEADWTVPFPHTGSLPLLGARGLWPCGRASLKECPLLIRQPKTLECYMKPRNFKMLIS